MPGSWRMACCWRLRAAGAARRGFGAGCRLDGHPGPIGFPPPGNCVRGTGPRRAFVSWFVS
jgi:hypothetical protein